MTTRTSQIRFRRRGLAAADLLILVFAGSTMVAAAVLVTPQMLNAKMSSSEMVVERCSEAQAATNALSLILRRSAATLGPKINTSNAGESAESSSLILWTEDVVDPGYLNLSEVLVLEHSRILESVSAYFFNPSDPTDPIFNPKLPDRLVREPQRLMRYVLEHSQVQSQVIAVNVAEFRIEREAVASGRGGQNVTPGEAWIVIRCSAESDDTDAEMRVPAPLPSWATLSPTGG